MNDLGKIIKCHFIHAKRGLLSVQNLYFAPSVGDKIRFQGATDAIYYSVVRKVWVYDEPEALFSRLNIEVTEAL